MTTAADELLRHDDVCGACQLPPTSHAPTLLCRKCPAMFHYPCAGYYDESGAFQIVFDVRVAAQLCGRGFADAASVIFIPAFAW